MTRLFLKFAGYLAILITSPLAISQPDQEKPNALTKSIKPGQSIDFDVENRTYQISYDVLQTKLSELGLEPRSSEMTVKIYEEGNKLDLSDFDAISIVVPLHQISSAPPNGFAKVIVERQQVGSQEK
jgi:hypothetical protein